jgi:hypothetical protein
LNALEDLFGGVLGAIFETSFSTLIGSVNTLSGMAVSSLFSKLASLSSPSGHVDVMVRTSAGDRRTLKKPQRFKTVFPNQSSEMASRPENIAGRMRNPRL